ncbi:hypothetical protein Moror_13778 [Moniliophthora roreri MCA 2997]|uniref:Uncharacterized protein n=1 Tax=Moniliophthora roreri (strain MCA 2997) TaxID=1381753 RepID=V2YF84_MONRO|nr:hypothetical protein Moror_13778 [Moniliophthora roreri MCA 2997]
MYNVFRATEDPPTRGKNSDFKLSKKAFRILEGPDGPKGFIEQYGHYFAYACESKSSFAAACNFPSDSMDSSSIRTVIDMELVGFDMRGFNTSTLGGAPRSFEDFIDQAKPAPYMRSLLHYSAVESRIPSPVEQFKDFSQTVSLMLQRLYTLQCDHFSCPMERTKVLSDGISEASSEVLQVNPSDSKAMGEWSKKIDGFGEEARRWKDGDQVLRDGLKLTTLDYVKRK